MRNNFEKKILFIYLLVFALNLLGGVITARAVDISVSGPSNSELQGPVNELNQLSRQSPVTEAGGFLTILAAITPGQIPNNEDLGIKQTSPVKDVSGLVSILAQVVRWVYVIFFILAVLFILFAAYNYLSAGDKEENVSKAHNQLFWTAIAIAVALLAVSAEVIIKNFLSP